MWSLFSGCVVPEVAILPWPPLSLSKPCNQCAALCTGMSLDTQARTQRSSTSDERLRLRVRLIRSCSCRLPVMRGLFEANNVFAVWHILLGSYKASVGSIHKVSKKKKEGNCTTNRSLMETVRRKHGLPGACSYLRLLLNVSMLPTQRLDANEFKHFKQTCCG